MTKITYPGIRVSFNDGTVTLTQKAGDKEQEITLHPSTLADLTERIVPNWKPAELYRRLGVLHDRLTEHLDDDRHSECVSRCYEAQALWETVKVMTDLAEQFIADKPEGQDIQPHHDPNQATLI